MDNLTHTLAGVTLANAFLRKRAGPSAVPVMMIASNIADIDAVVMASGNPLAVTLRRTFGHSLLVTPILAAALAWSLRKLYPKIEARAMLGMCLLGMGTHLLFDWLNSFGVVFFWPLSMARSELAMVFIIDLILIGLLAMPLALRLIPSQRSRLESLSKRSLACVAFYFLFCAANRALAYRALNRAGADEGAAWTYVFPEPLGPHRWRGVERAGNTYRLYLVNSLTGSVEPRGEEPTMLGDPYVEAARMTSQARRLEWFFKAPVWSADAPTPQGAVIRVWDMRFGSLVLGFKNHFSYRFLVRPDGHVDSHVDKS